MKRILLVTALLITLTGCAYFHERIDAASQCQADPTCLADVKQKAAIAKTIGDATGYPAAGAVAGGIVAALMLFFARKKKEGQ